MRGAEDANGPHRALNRRTPHTLPPHLLPYFLGNPNSSSNRSSSRHSDFTLTCKSR